MKDNSDDNWSVDVPVFNIDTGMEDWVGEGDAIDYRSFTLDYAVRVSFDLNATDATKFTIWKFDSKTKKLKSLQATTLAKDTTNGNYTFGDNKRTCGCTKPKRSISDYFSPRMKAIRFNTLMSGTIRPFPIRAI